MAISYYLMFDDLKLFVSLHFSYMQQMTFFIFYILMKSFFLTKDFQKSAVQKLRLIKHR